MLLLSRSHHCRRFVGRPTMMHSRRCLPRQHFQLLIMRKRPFCGKALVAVRSLPSPRRPPLWGGREEGRRCRLGVFYRCRPCTRCRRVCRRCSPRHSPRPCPVPSPSKITSGVANLWAIGRRVQDETLGGDLGMRQLRPRTAPLLGTAQSRAIRTAQLPRVAWV